MRHIRDFQDISQINAVEDAVGSHPCPHLVTIPSSQFIVWAQTTDFQQVLDTACDLGQLKSIELDEETRDQWEIDGWHYTSLGNEGIPHDLSYVDIEALYQF